MNHTLTHPHPLGCISLSIFLYIILHICNPSVCKFVSIASAICGALQLFHLWNWNIQKRCNSKDPHIYHLELTLIFIIGILSVFFFPVVFKNKYHLMVFNPKTVVLNWEWFWPLQKIVSNVWRRFWEMLIYWVEPGMPLNILQCTGQSPPLNRELSGSNCQ